MRVAVLGCGPAGLMAVSAAIMADPYADIIVLSNKRKSKLYGAQYLHAPIPGYTDEENFTQVAYLLKGETDDYRRKVYGPMWDGTVSPEDLTAEHRAWDIRETYDRLWEDYEDIVENVQIDPAGLRWILDGKSKWGRFNLVISSLHAQTICTEGHQFQSVKIRAAGDAPALGVELPYRCAEDTVVCNGDDHPSYYRLSNIFGHKTVEWPEWIDPPITHVFVDKPLKTNCDCWPQMLRVGRYGKWEKGVLTHHGYEEVRQHVNGILDA